MESYEKFIRKMWKLYIKEKKLRKCTEQIAKQPTKEKSRHGQVAATGTDFRRIYAVQTTRYRIVGQLLTSDFLKILDVETSEVVSDVGVVR